MMEPILEHDLVHPCCEDDGLCIVCLESERNTRLPCGHELMCGPCAVKLMKVKAICPTCRTRFQKIKFSSNFGKVDYDPPRKSDEVSIERNDVFVTQRTNPLEFPRRNSLDGQKVVLDGTCRVFERVKDVCKKLCEDNQIVTLSLAENFLGIEEARVIASALRVNRSLRYLNLSSNELGDEGAEILVDALKSNTTLIELDLNGNGIGKKGARVIKSLLESNQTIQVLRLYDNNLGDKGALLIGKSLKRNTSLRVLNIRSNKIGPEALIIVAKHLSSNSTLKKIDIGFNSRVKKQWFPSGIEVSVQMF